MRSLLCPLLTVSIFAAAAFGDDRIELRTGDVLRGEIVERTDDHVVVEHAVLGRLNIPVDQIASMPQPPTAVDVPVDPEAQPELPPERAPWKSQIDLGLAGSRGNTETLDVRAAFLTIQESERHRWRIDASYFYSRDDGGTNRNSATAGVLRDWLMPDSPWLFFAQGRYDYDEFRDWTHRVSGHGGVGYQFIDTDEFTLIGRLGAGAAKEWKRSAPLRPEGLIGGEFVWNISERQRLAAASTLYPDLGDFFEFRVVSAIQWTMQMDFARGLALSAGIEHEYESQTSPGVEHSDLKFYTGVTFQF